MMAAEQVARRRVRGWMVDGSLRKWKVGCPPYGSTIPDRHGPALWGLMGDCDSWNRGWFCRVEFWSGGIGIAKRIVAYDDPGAARPGSVRVVRGSVNRETGYHSGVTFPLAYHITFGTYGMRLHGDARGTVDRKMNGPGEAIVGRCEELEKMERGRLKFPPRELTREQQMAVQLYVPTICARGGWKYIECAGARDHVHVVLGAQAEGDAVRKWFKRWLSEAMNSRWPVREGETWWAEAGSVKWVWTEDYLETVTKYVRDQRVSR